MMKNLKGFGRKRSWPDFKVLSQHLPVETEENYENLNQHSDRRGRESNPGSPKYEVLKVKGRLLIYFN
jgi:hypothetical protein